MKRDVSDPLDDAEAAIHHDLMTRFEVIRVGLLAMLGAWFLALDLNLLYQPPVELAQAFRVLAALHGELALACAGIVFWPGRRWLRIMLGGFVITLAWLCITKLAVDQFLFQPTLVTRLSVGSLMVASYCLPCAAFFIVSRKRGRRLLLFRRPIETHDRSQFGIRYLFIFTTCFAVVALAARAVFPTSLTGQFTLSFDVEEFTMLSLLCLFPGLATGPLALAVMRPSWHILWILPWILLLGAAELFIVGWSAPGAASVQIAAQVLRLVASIAGGYVDLIVILVVVFGIARISGLSLS